MVVSTSCSQRFFIWSQFILTTRAKIGMFYHSRFSEGDNLQVQVGCLSNNPTRRLAGGRRPLRWPFTSTISLKPLNQAVKQKFLPTSSSASVPFHQNRCDADPISLGPCFQFVSRAPQQLCGRF